MKHSETIGKLVTSLIAAKKNITLGLKRDAANPNFDSQYVTLGSVIEAVTAPLEDQGIMLFQTQGHYENGRVIVSTKLCHSSNEWIGDDSSSPVDYADSQAVGSTATYLRRYSLMALMGLYQADDDGNQASSRNGSSQLHSNRAVAPSHVASQSAVVDVETARKFAQWKKNIANASNERLLQARESAKTTFTGSQLKEILVLIDMHIAACKETDPFSV